MKALIYIIVSFAITYAGFAFIFFKVNPSLWTEGARVAFVLFGTVVSGMAITFPGLPKND